MDRLFLILGSVMAFLAVALGAFGAHGLRSRVSADMLAIFETGVRYQMYHALGLLGVAWACSRWPESGAQWAGWAFIVGIVVFSGTLYLLTLSGMRWLGAITPLGGVAFLIGWMILVWAALKA